MKIMALLARLVEALESQAALMQEQVVAQREARERMEADRQREAEEMQVWQQTQQDVLRQTIANQEIMIARQKSDSEAAEKYRQESERRSREHIDSCNAAHRRLEAQYGLTSDEQLTKVQ